MKSIHSAILACALLSASATRAFAAQTPAEVITLWPNGAPGDTGNIGEEHDTSKPGDRPAGGRAVIRIGNVSKPTLSIFRPAKDLDCGAAVMVCPGGGYNILAFDLEGTEVCEWLNSIGVTAALLKYRVPTREGQKEDHLAPFQDAQRAMGILRSRAGDWGVDPKRVGILGFSAGGHLSARTSNAPDKRSYDPIDSADQASCHPDFTLLIYPAYLTTKEEPDQLIPMISVSKTTPPAFVVQTEDDGVGVGNAMAYARALQKLRVPVELHVFAVGGHGYGMRETDDQVTRWPTLATAWLRGRKLLGAH